MVKRSSATCVAVGLALACSGCGHTRTSRLGVISFGDLAGKTIPANVEGPIVQGRSGARVFRAPSYFLSDAARDALKGSRFDTLVDVEVTTRTGLAVPSNQIEVRGKALDSHTLQ